MRHLLILTITLATIVTSCSSGSSADKPDEHHDSDHAHEHNHRFDDPEEYTDRWNSPERAEWQKPREVIDLMELEPGMTVADLGAGTGYFIPYLAAGVAPDGKVIALDVEQAMIDFLEKQKREKGWSFVEPRKTEFDDPGLGKQSVDRVLTVNTWHHIQDREAYAQKLASALKDGGFVVVVDYEKESEGGGPPPEMRLEPSQIEAELASAGLQTEVAEESLPRQYVVIARKL